MKKFAKIFKIDMLHNFMGGPSDCVFKNHTLYQNLTK